MHFFLGALRVKIVGKYTLFSESNLSQRGFYMVWEINMEVCPCLEFGNFMLFICLGLDFYIYGAFEFLCNSIANL